VKCDTCGGKMMIAGSRFVSEEGSTDVFQELKLVCINPKCPNYAGSDLNRAEKYETLRRKVN